jgi:carbon-monoxide dehydrogenase medium subunit
LAGYAGGARPLAGGTDLIPKIKDGAMQPQGLISLKGLGLAGITEDSSTIVIGSLTTLTEIVDSPVIARRLPLLKQTAAEIASVHIRNRATIGGNLCNAAPSADMSPALLVLGARARITGPGGEWTVPLEEFFTGPGQTVLAPGDLFVDLEIPLLPDRSAAYYIKHSVRRAMDIATVGVALALNVDKLGTCQDCRIALGAVAPTPIRAWQAEKMIIGQKLEMGVVELAAQAAASEARPISDLRSSAEYRQRMVAVHVRRALLQAAHDLKQ